jgi:hypothetical protein
MVRAKRKKHIGDMKKLIIQYVRDNQKKLAKSFYPARKPEDLEPALADKNWVHIDKYLPLSYNYEVVTEFDCRPYNDKLRAYVYTTPDGFKIENVIVQTE